MLCKVDFLPGIQIIGYLMCYSNNFFAYFLFAITVEGGPRK
jgi:hypothetical protein